MNTSESSLILRSGLPKKDNTKSLHESNAYLTGVLDDRAEAVGQLILDMNRDLNSPFKTTLQPSEMRQLALVAHNHMKPAMKEFVTLHSEIIKKFRVTGTNTTIRMCKEIFKDDPDVEYGNTFTSGPLGGDAQLAALMILEDVGGIVFFIDPLSAHPHQADIDSLIRLANVNNIMICTNPTTGICMMHLLRNALVGRKKEMFPSFFHTLESPAVPEYKAAQEHALASVTKNVNGGSTSVEEVELRASQGLLDDGAMELVRKMSFDESFKEDSSKKKVTFKEGFLKTARRMSVRKVF